MVFFNWLADSVGGRKDTRSHRPFVSLYDKEGDGKSSGHKSPSSSAPRRQFHHPAAARPGWSNGFRYGFQGYPAAPGRWGPPAALFQGRRPERGPDSTPFGARSRPGRPASSPRTRCGQHTAVALDRQQPFMPPTRGCMTPQQLLDKMNVRYESTVNKQKLATYRRWLRHTIVPKIDRAGTGAAVSVRDMEKIIDFFGEIIFWNALPRTRFRWTDLSDQNVIGQESEDGRLIEVDPEPHSKGSGDDILSTLLHECCHALLDQKACNGACWSSRCADAWSEQVDPEEGHGPVFVKLARGAERLCNSEGLFKCSTGWENY